MTAVVAALIAYGAVFGVPNTPTPGGAQYDLAGHDGTGGYQGRHRDTDPGAVLGRPADPDL